MPRSGRTVETNQSSSVLILHSPSLRRSGRFPQAPRVNRRLSPLGFLWRDIESYLAVNPGLYCFVRLVYPVGTSTDIPVEVEYGVAAEGQFRVVVFPNNDDQDAAGPR